MKHQKRIGYRHRHPFIFYTVLLLILSMAAGAFLAVRYVKGVIDETPTVTEAMLKSDPTSNMYAADGTLIWSESIRRDYIKMKDVPELYRDLLLATEDRTFYQDGGFSYKGLANAGLSLIKEKLGQGEARGGSSIEQQLIKYVVFSTDRKDRTIDRKIKELWLSQQLYENFSKDQILEWYINRIDLGENSHGADTIARTYYGQSLSDMDEYTPENISRMAVIAGLGQAPGRYNLYTNAEAVRDRRNIVLYSALSAGVLTEAQYEAALDIDVKHGLKPRYWRNQVVQAETRRHSAYISSVLTELRRLGYDIERTPMQIHTALDRKKDLWLRDLVNGYGGYKDGDQQLAVTVMDNDTGTVIAQSGGRGEGELNRSTVRTRSSGSSIKPFIDYAPAIEFLGYGTNVMLDSSPYTYPGTNFTAKNFGGWSYGMVDMKKALRWSLNTPAIRLLDEHVGSDNAKAVLSKMGLDVKDSYGGADALGLDVSTEQLAAAYSTLANGGKYREPRYIDTIRFADESERTIRYGSVRAMKESTAYILLKILEGTTARQASAEKADIPEFRGHAVKTGTVAYSQDGVWRPDTAASDAWLAGTTKDISVALWTGYDIPNKPNHWVLEEQTVRHNVYKQVMRHYNSGRDTGTFSRPDTVFQSGSGLTADYSPTDTDTRRFNIPEAAATGTGDIFSGDFTVKDDPVKAPDAPKGYQTGSWMKDYKDKDRTILEKWQQDEPVPDETTLPDDVYTGEGD